MSWIVSVVSVVTQSISQGNQTYNSNNFAFLLHFLAFFFFPGTEISSMAVNKQLASSPVTISEK